MPLPHPCRLLLSALLVSAAACSSGGGDGGESAPASSTGALRLVATDAPLDHALVDEARVQIDRIGAHVDAAAEAGFEILYDGPAFEVDLATLRNGVTRALAGGELPSGTYTQFRLRLAGGSLRLVNGRVYTSEDGTLKLTSQMQSGYKVLLDPGVEVESGVERTVILDFDLSKTFKPVPANDPENAARFLMHPNVRAAVRSRSGEVRGTVRLADGELRDVSVHVMRPGEDDLDASIATTAADADGSAAVLGLAPGVYDVVAVHGGSRAVQADVVVSAGTVASFELALE